MSFAVGQIVVPARRYLGRDSVCTVSASGRRIYHERELYDFAGRRTAFGLVAEVLGDSALERSYFDRSGRLAARTLIVNPTVTPAAWTGSTAYAVGDVVTSSGRVWRCTVGGTSAGVAPTGDGTTYVEGSGVEWLELQAPENSDGLTDVVRTSPIYRVRVWDVALLSLTSDYYPESELAAFTSFEEWRQLGPDDRRSADPTHVLPYVASGHVDLLTNDDVRQLARAYELSGVDPRG